MNWIDYGVLFISRTDCQSAFLTVYNFFFKKKGEIHFVKVFPFNRPLNILKWLSLWFLIVAHQEDHDLTLDMNEIKVKFSRLHLTGLPKFNCWWCKLDLVDTLVLLSTSLQNYLPHCGLSNAWYAGEQRLANYGQIPSLYSLWAKNGFYTFIWLKKNQKTTLWFENYMKFKFACPYMTFYWKTVIHDTTE